MEQEQANCSSVSASSSSGSSSSTAPPPAIQPLPLLADLASLLRLWLPLYRASLAASLRELLPTWPGCSSSAHSCPSGNVAAVAATPAAPVAVAAPATPPAPDGAAPPAAAEPSTPPGSGLGRAVDAAELDPHADLAALLDLPLPHADLVRCLEAGGWGRTEREAVQALLWREQREGWYRQLGVDALLSSSGAGPAPSLALVWLHSLAPPGCSGRPVASLVHSCQRVLAALLRCMAATATAAAATAATPTPFTAAATASPRPTPPYGRRYSLSRSALGSV